MSCCVAPKLWAHWSPAPSHCCFSYVCSKPDLRLISPPQGPFSPMSGPSGHTYLPSVTAWDTWQARCDPDTLQTAAHGPQMSCPSSQPRDLAGWVNSHTQSHCFSEAWAEDREAEAEELSIPGSALSQRPSSNSPYMCHLSPSSPVLTQSSSNPACPQLQSFQML